VQDQQYDNNYLNILFVTHTYKREQIRNIFQRSKMFMVLGKPDLSS
jgi:hypothetical protein